MNAHREALSFKTIVSERPNQPSPRPLSRPAVRIQSSALFPISSARLLDIIDQLKAANARRLLANLLKTQSCLRATFVTVVRLDYHGTVSQTVENRNRRVRLLLDELGYLPIDKRGADLLFQVVAARYEIGSIVLSTNRPFRDWGTLFDMDNTLATALIDRLMHHGEAIVIDGESYRMRGKDPNSPSA